MNAIKARLLTIVDDEFYVGENDVTSQFGMPRFQHNLDLMLAFRCLLQAQFRGQPSSGAYIFNRILKCVGVDNLINAIASFDILSLDAVPEQADYISPDPLVEEDPQFDVLGGIGCQVIWNIECDTRSVAGERPFCLTWTSPQIVSWRPEPAHGRSLIITRCVAA